MKRQLFLCTTSLLLGVASLWGQRQNLSGVKQLDTPFLSTVRATIPSFDNVAKTATCVDTLAYVEAKRSLLNTHYISGILLFQSDADKIAMTFTNNGSLTITGVELFATNRAFDGPTPTGSPTTGITVKASVYNVNSSNRPTTLLGSATALLTYDWDDGGDIPRTYITFSPAITVTSNYAISVETTTTGGLMMMLSDTVAPANTTVLLNGNNVHEGLASFYTDYNAYTSPGNWIAAEEETNITDGDFEPFISPIVSYSLTANGSVPLTANANSPVTFTNTTDVSVFNKMTNASMFLKHWKNYPQDSIYVWSPSGDISNTSTDLMWTSTGDATHTYTVANTYTPKLAVLGGLINGCQDVKDFSITINPEGTPPGPCSISGATTVCPGQSITLTVSAGGGSWSTSDASIASVNNGVVVAASDATGSVTISYGNSANCTGTATHPITISTDCGEGPPPPTPCSISGATTVCPGESITLTASADGGSWNASPTGIVEVINGVVTGKAVGQVTISYGSSPNCTGTGTKVVTVTNCTAVGIDETDAFASVTIAPNPTNSMITIAGLPQQATITVSDLNGKTLLVQHTYSTQAQLSLDSFVNGVYFVNVQSEEINGVRKIVLNK